MAAEMTAEKLLPESLRAKIRAYIPRYPRKQAVTLPALHMVHEHFRCVPYRAMAEIAEILDLAPAEVVDTMSFYGFFPQAPIGDVRVWVCRSLSCMLTGGDEILEETCRKLGVRNGQTTADGKVHVEFAECLGICDFAPAALADDGRIFGPLNQPGKVDAMIAEVRKGPVDSSHGMDPGIGSTSPSAPAT